MVRWAARRKLGICQSRQRCKSTAKNPYQKEELELSLPATSRSVIIGENEQKPDQKGRAAVRFTAAAHPQRAKREENMERGAGRVDGRQLQKED